MRAEPDRTLCMCTALRGATRAVTRLYDDALRGTGLRVTQYAILARLARVGEVTQRDLGRRLHLDETTLTRSLRPLERQGLIATRPGEDRREKRLAVTAAGRRRVEAAWPAWARAQARLREALSPAAWDDLARTLPEVARAAAAESPGQPVSPAGAGH
jgi:DNA-binding MarR family transcriptional regulator